MRATFFGLAAGCGKVGALLGAAAFGPIADAIGIEGVYWCCAALALLGVVTTLSLIPLPTAAPPLVEHGANTIQNRTEGGNMASGHVRLLSPVSERSEYDGSPPPPVVGARR